MRRTIITALTLMSLASLRMAAAAPAKSASSAAPASPAHSASAAASTKAAGPASSAHPAASASAAPSASVKAQPLDPAAELKAIHERERKHRAQAQSNQKAWNDSRPQRAEAHRQDLTRIWGDVTQKPEAITELKLHADRMARLHRALDLAEHKHEATLVDQINDLIEREITRDARTLDALRPKAGTP